VCVELPTYIYLENAGGFWGIAA